MIFYQNSQTAGKTEYSHGLVVFRALAIILALAWHFSEHSPGEIAHFLKITGPWGGANPFFVLSGFLLGGQLFSKIAKGEAFSIKKYYLRRVFRTWPAYFFAVALFCLLPILSVEPGRPPLWSLLSFSQNFILEYGIFSYTWSLCVEEQFYLVLPVLFFVFKGGFRPRFFFSAVVAAVLFGLILRGVLQHTYVESSVLERSYQYVSKIYYPTWCRLDGLLFGVTLAAVRIFYPDKWMRLIRRSHLWLACGCLIACFGFYLQMSRFRLLPSILVFPLVSLGWSFILLSAVNRESLFSRCKIPGVTLLASLSYSLYLMHRPAFLLLTVGLKRMAIHESLSIHLVAGFAASLVCALFLYVFVEAPFLRLRDRIG